MSTIWDGMTKAEADALAAIPKCGEPLTDAISTYLARGLQVMLREVLTPLLQPHLPGSPEGGEQ